MYLCVVLGLLLFACGGPPPVISEAVPVAESAPLPEYRLIFIIHGDGGYLYHDTAGNDYRADEVALAGAQKVAEHNAQAEVLIFHEKHRRHFLFVFPRRDGVFYYYRNGRLLAQESYWRNQGQYRFAPEIALYDRLRSQGTHQLTKMFFYLGHEIPEIGGRDYDASYRDRPFTVDDLAGAMRQFNPDSTKFNLIMLSTCFNGTPHTIAALSPYARYIIASPGNLHLSYFDLQPFENLDAGMRGKNMRTLADDCAKLSFDRLTSELQTEVTVAVYDVDLVQTYVHAVDSLYDRALNISTKKTLTSIEHCDCAEDSAYVRPAMSDGVNMFFRSARFGRSAHKQGHSGWECLKFLK